MSKYLLHVFYSRKIQTNTLDRFKRRAERITRVYVPAFETGAAYMRGGSLRIRGLARLRRLAGA